MSRDLQALKTAVSFRQLVSETHMIGADHKTHCPVHDDHNPSCHIYPDGAHCYACGWHADHIGWLEAVHALSTLEAIEQLEKRVDGVTRDVAPRRSYPRPKAPTFTPVDERTLGRHRHQAAQLHRAPSSMGGRGFSLEDLRRMSVAAQGDDAVFPIFSPDGTVLALKRRYAEPGDGQRYCYVTKGHGCPAWSSPGFLKAETVLVVEGELNAMSCWLACPDLGVQGIAGTGGALHLEALRGRTVYVYGDSDEPGQKARDRWAAQALEAGASKVFALEPWPVDACDLAGGEGRAALRARLASSLKGAPVFPPLYPPKGHLTKTLVRQIKVRG